MHCAWPTPTTAAGMARCCSATFLRPKTAAAASFPVAWSSPACRTMWWRMKPPMPCSTASTSTFWSPPTPMCWLSTRPLPTSWQCSSTSHCPSSCATRLPKPGATWAPRTCWRNWRPSLAMPAAHMARCATPSAATTRPARPGCATSPTRPSWSARPRSMRAAQSWSLPCSTPSCRSTACAPATCCAWPAVAPACCNRANCTPTWWPGWRTKRPTWPARC